MSAAPILYEELAEDIFTYDGDWLELHSNTSPGNASFSEGGGVATITGTFPANMMRSALRYFLGYSYADDTAPYSLHRELPARHPRFPNLYAHSISFSEIAPQKVDDANNVKLLSPFPASDLMEGNMFYTKYQKAIATIQYKSFGRMRFLPDTDIEDYTDEYKRYVTFSTEASMEALSADNASNLAFAEGPADDPNTLAFPAPLATLMGKTALTLKWWWVPHNYLSTDPDILLMDKILGRALPGDTAANYGSWKYPPRIGTVNKDFFLGFYPGTLLLRAVKAEEILYPVTTADSFTIAGGYHLTFVWEHFDPVKGVPYDPITSPYRGHRVFPYRKNGNWYYATRESGDELIPLIPHIGIFQNVNDPSSP